MRGRASEGAFSENKRQRRAVAGGGARGGKSVKVAQQGIRHRAWGGGRGWAGRAKKRVEGGLGQGAIGEGIGGRAIRQGAVTRCGPAIRRAGHGAGRYGVMGRGIALPACLLHVAPVPHGRLVHLFDRNHFQHVMAQHVFHPVPECCA